MKIFGRPLLWGNDIRYGWVRTWGRLIICNVFHRSDWEEVWWGSPAYACAACGNVYKRVESTPAEEGKNG